MAGPPAPLNLPSTMKAAIIALVLGALLTGCSRQPPYTTVAETNNPPRADAAFTNPIPTNAVAPPKNP
jgi:hypothetical protein